MKRVEFAELAGITPAMVTKYGEQGLLVLTSPKEVDARATLAALAGRLDEDKRRAALDKLDAAARIAETASVSPANANQPARPAGKSAKTEIDELKRDTLQLELARKAGELIPIADVEDFIARAVEELKAAYEVEARATVDQLQIDLNLSPNHAAMLVRRLRTLSNRARHRFSLRLLELVGDDGANTPHETEPEDEAAGGER